MKVKRWNTIMAIVLLVPVAVLDLGCNGSASVETIPVSMRNTETYEYPTVGGDEEGARITSQASHYRTSEIRRNAETNWVAVYVYQPEEGFVGSDQVTLEISTGSDGASGPTNVKRIVLRFTIRE